MSSPALTSVANASTFETITTTPPPSLTLGVWTTTDSDGQETTFNPFTEWTSRKQHPFPTGLPPDTGSPTAGAAKLSTGKCDRIL